MDGVLVVDKPAGLTSHDVVAAVRRATGERRIGHTGTLDPLATGVLPLVCGRATRLARFFTASDKTYEATIRFGLATDTYDVTGTEVRRTGRVPDRAELERAVAVLAAATTQVPPPFSAKKIAGQRAYELARRQVDVALTPVPIRVDHAEVQHAEGPWAVVRLSVSAGFYVRAFAHDLGELVGTGACLEALRRTRSGEFSLEDAIPLARIVERPAEARERLVAMERLLPGLPVVRVTAEGRHRVTHGQTLGPAHLRERPPAAAGWVRLFDAEERLLALGLPKAGGLLHPALVLI
jgi:tRNA pseudouridine55 synthase